MTPRRAQSSPVFNRSKRAWRVLDPLERLGWLLITSALVVSAVTVVLKHRQLDARVQALKAGWIAPTPTPILDAMTLIGQFMPPLGFGTLWIGHRRSAARTRRHRFALCPGCGHDLAATRRAAHCPECGRAFGPKGYIREWGRIYPRRGRRWGDPIAIVRHPEAAR